MATAHATGNLKSQLQAFWNADPCGSRYLGEGEAFDSHARARYALEPHIHEFADFACARGLKVLEIGVGMGADYLEWLKAGALATGVDLSDISLRNARRRCLLAGYQPDLRVADAEHLPFADESFDLVYSYGVMHHSPDTQTCLREAWRVLRPGGRMRVMLYHHPSLTGFMLWLRYGLWRGKSLRKAVFDHLESPGTKSFTKSEVRSMMAGFANLEMRQVFSPGDLLLNRPSPRFQSSVYKLIWALYPRTVVGRVCGRLGLFLLVSGRKPGQGTLR